MKGFFHYTPITVRFHKLTIPADTFYGYYGTQIFCTRGAFHPGIDGTPVFLHVDGKWQKCYLNDEFTKRLNRQREQIIMAQGRVRYKQQMLKITDYPDCVPMSYVPSPKTYKSDF